MGPTHRTAKGSESKSFICPTSTEEAHVGKQLEMLGAVWEPWQVRDQEHQTPSLRDDQKFNRKGQRASHKEENRAPT